MQHLTSLAFDIRSIRSQFPILDQTIQGKPLIYLDNAATTQKPKRVIDTLLHYYQYENANVQRGLHTLAERATEGVEKTRHMLQHFIHAAQAEEIIFTAGTTASINLVAATYGQTHLQAGDEVLISQLEHHSNIVPWQAVCQAKGAILKALPITDTGTLDLTTLSTWLTNKTKIVAITHVSNTLGTINPLQPLIAQAHAQGAIVVVDGAQAIPHLPIDVQALDCDFYAFSAHKMYGPTGVGALYGKRALLADLLPYQYGGGMVERVTLEKTTYSAIPYRFEAGTPPLASIIAWQEALAFLQEIGPENQLLHEQKLRKKAEQALACLPYVQRVGMAHDAVGILAFTLQGLHPLDVGLLLDAQGIAVRTGDCCAQPLLARLGLPGVVRVSFAVYNTEEEIEQWAAYLAQIGQRVHR